MATFACRNEGIKRRWRKKMLEALQCACLFYESIEILPEVSSAPVALSDGYMEGGTQRKRWNERRRLCKALNQVPEPTYHPSR